MENIRTEEIFDDDDTDKEWEVEKILNERPRRHKNPKTGKMEYIKEYLIKWVGFKSPTWEPEINLLNSQDLLKEFLLKQVMKKLNKEKPKTKTPHTFEIYENKTKSPNKDKRKNTESQTGEDISTFSYSNSNNIISNRITINNNPDNNEKMLTISEEEKIEKKKEKEDEKKKKKEKDVKKKKEKIKNIDKKEDINMDMYYDIEIIDEKKNSENKKQRNESINIINNVVDIPSKELNKGQSNKKKDISDKLKYIDKHNEINISNKKKLNDNKKSKINYNVINEEENNNDLTKFSQTIYIDEEIEEEEKSDKSKSRNSRSISSNRKKIYEKKNEVINYLEKKRAHTKKDIYSEEKDENDIKVIGIYSMKVPNEYEKGIIVNIKYKKNNKIFIEEFNTQSEEIPSDYLVKYYEMFICEFFKGQIYSQELCFD